jgi:Protein of unknown function (DUF5818)
MKKAIITTLMLLVGATWAQNYPSERDRSSSSVQTTIIQGCLGHTNGSFTLTDKAGTRYELTGDTATLNDHVGHEVQIKGTKTELTTPTGTSEATSNRTEARIDVSSLKHISETCSAKSKSSNPPMSEKPPIPAR